MMDAVARARGCLGVRFRRHGRTIDGGLDCVGLAAVAYRLERVPAGYRLRGGMPAPIEAALDAAGFARVAAPAAGDLLVVEAGPFQPHLAVWTGAGFVHADAGLGRVVEVPGRPRWPILSAWRKD